MFEILEALSKAALAVVTVPVSAAADVVTLGGALTDQEEPYTRQAVGDFLDNLRNATDPKK